MKQLHNSKSPKFLLGPLLETHFRRALIISNGSYATFFTHPMSAIFLCAAIVSVLYPVIRWAIKKSVTPKA